MPRARHADTRVKTGIQRRGMRISMAFWMELCRPEHPHTPAIVFASDVEAYPSYGPQIDSADGDHLLSAGGKHWRSSGPACTALVIWRSGARIGQADAGCSEAFETSIAAPRPFRLYARLRWLLFEMRTRASPGLRALLHLSGRLTDLRHSAGRSAYVLTAARQVCVMPRIKPQKDERSPDRQ